MTGTAVAKIEHATLGASSAKRWMNCTGSVSLIESLPPEQQNKETIYAAEGTAAHSVAAQCLQENHEAIEFLGREITVGEHVFTVDEDMVDAIQLYLDTVRREYEPDKGDIIFVEKRFSLEKFNPPRPMFGTSDVSVFKPRFSKLVVADFKYGAGVVVDATDNDQGRYYGLGACLALIEYPIAEVEVVIVQPRAPHADGPVRRETVDAGALIEWSATLLDKARETLDPNAPRCAGDWCRFCPAAAVCPELRQHAAAVAKAEFDSDLNITVNLPNPSDLSNEELARVLDGGWLLKTWWSACYALASERAQHGLPIPGWKVVDRRPRRYWKSENEDEVAGNLMLGYGLTEEQIFERKLRSPAQVEKEIKGRGSKPVREKMNAELVDKRSSGATLAPESDRRPAIDGSLALEFADDPLGE